MRVPFFDFEREEDEVLERMHEACGQVLRSRRFIGGPGVAHFEQKFAEYCGAEHAIGVSSGTDALLVSLMALGIGPGDEVIVPDFTFVSPAGCVVRLGATPVFVDIDADSFNILPEAVEPAITEKTRAIIAVHLFGEMADMTKLQRIAEEKGILILEDAAQAIGATQRGSHAGTIGAVGCFSFYPTKNLGGAGDGGMVITDDDALAERIRLLKNHGARPKYHHIEVGGNFRLDAMQAAILDVRLDYLDRWTGLRRENARRYQMLLADADVVLPNSRSYNGPHTYHQFCIRSSQRDALRERLAAAGVDTMIYYPSPLSEQPAFADAIHRPSAEAHLAASQILALPIFPHLSPEEIEYVAEMIQEKPGRNSDQTFRLSPDESS